MQYITLKGQYKDRSDYLRSNFDQLVSLIKTKKLNISINLLDSLENGQWNRLKAKQFFINISQIDISYFNLSLNIKSQIIKQIEPMSFPFLTQINLSNNSISSIEPLQNLQMKSLKYIDLNYNKITQTNSLRKCKFPNLVCLQISYNQIKSFQGLNELLLNKYGLENICILNIKQKYTDFQRFNDENGLNTKNSIKIYQKNMQIY